MKEKFKEYPHDSWDMKGMFKDYFYTAWEFHAT